MYISTMLIRMSKWFPSIILLETYPGRLGIELDAPSDKENECGVSYHGQEGINHHLSPSRILPENTNNDDGMLTFFIDPPTSAHEHQVLSHRYLIKLEGGDTYVRHPKYVHMTLIEHNSENRRIWELNLEGFEARIVMPSDFKACEEVHET